MADVEEPPRRMWLASPADYPLYPNSHAGHMAGLCVCPTYGGRARCSDCGQIICKDCGGEADAV